MAVDVLRQYWGHESFRPGQSELVEAVLTGRDALGVLPTGAGKSVCYQLPAVMLEGMTLVVSPLIALMEDQVRSLKKKGIAAASLSGSTRNGFGAKRLRAETLSDPAGLKTVSTRNGPCHLSTPC